MIRLQFVKEESETLNKQAQTGVVVGRIRVDTKDGQDGKALSEL